MTLPRGDRLGRKGDTITVGSQSPVILMPPLLGMRGAASLFPITAFQRSTNHHDNLFVLDGGCMPLRHGLANLAQASAGSGVVAVRFRLVGQREQTC